MDISDREFYPCKCGYQVCIWCWHKIRKSENGLCPACRTPYGEDPHQFTALDVEEVLRANKEAQAAAKREKHIQNQLLQQQQQQQQLQQQQHNSHSHTIHNSHSASNNAAGSALSSSASASATLALSSAASLSANLANNNDTLNTSFDVTTDTASSTNVDGPKDRSSLANLRVIRRNLIYAVGLPPNIANEETLRKPEYFGQYGKLTKVVVNRSSPGGGDSNDPRRASSSAYITFQFKEDTLSCIMALDGFHFDNRTIRASYGTSKYCSAFMKHVRCSNPECTYLHEMGAAEDTFTKQEIQAGYVTSGCDVLARQQQILVEQQKLSGGHATLSATGAKLPTRKRVGGGGPSGTGKPHPNPIFPAPEFEEPIKPSIPPPSAITKASSTGNPGKITQTQSYVNATSVPAAKVGRAVSVGVLQGIATSSTSSTSPTIGVGINTQRKTQSGIATASTNATPNATTAASVVANSRRAPTSKDGTDAAQQHLTLTALTPLKRNTSTIKGKALPVVSEDEMMNNSSKIPGVRNGKKQSSSSSGRSATINIPTNIGHPNKSNPTSAVSTLSELQPSSDSNILIGGDVIGPSTSSLNGWNSSKPLNFGSSTGAISNVGNTIGSNSSASSLAELGGIPIPIPSTTSAASTTSTILGGELYTGPLLNQSREVSSIGSGGGGGSSLLGGLFLNDISSNVAGGEIGLRGSSASLWSGSILGGSSTSNNNSIIGGTGGSSSSTGVIGSHISNNNGINSSSALASILGINLPTGSGSLQESLWSATPYQHSGPSPLSMLNESTMQETQLNGGMGTQLRTVGSQQPPIQHTSVIGNRGQVRSSSASIGSNAPIGGVSGTIGASNNSQTSNINQQQSDVALLQILLPGVHITSDNGDNIGLRGGVPGWGNDPAGIGRHHVQQGDSNNRTGTIGSGGGSWVMGDGSNNNKTISTIGQPNYSQHQNQNANQGSGIW